MATPQQLAFLQQMYDAAKEAGHPWPDAAACEAAVETGWGAHVPLDSNNVLGIKAYRGWMGKTTTANGTEQNPNGTWTGPQDDQWCVFPAYADCFREQMRILQEPRYAEAMTAETILDYITAECKVWSTGILKGQAVLQVWNAHHEDLK